jgi:hypothetical protein
VSVTAAGHGNVLYMMHVGLPKQRQ